MKKIGLLLLVGLLIALTACGVKNARARRDALMKLDDDAFFEEIMFYCFDKISSVNDQTATDEQKTLYTLMNLQLEVENGGLCQFFANPSRECAPYVSEALEKAGEERIRKLYNDFVSENRIDVNDLSAFDIGTEEDLEDAFSALYDRYDFDAFDDAFYEDDDGLYTCIIEYAKANLENIVR